MPDKRLEEIGEALEREHTYSGGSGGSMTTHWNNCGLSGPGHYACLLRLLEAEVKRREELEALLLAMKEAGDA